MYPSLFVHYGVGNRGNSLLHGGGCPPDLAPVEILPFGAEATDPKRVGPQPWLRFELHEWKPKCRHSSLAPEP